MKNKKGTLIILICVILIIAAIGYTVVYTKTKKTKGFGNFGGQTQNTEFSVKTQIAEKTVLHDYVYTNGEIETQSSIQVFPSIGGKIASVKVTLGSTVKKGEVIAEIDPSVPGSTYAHSPVIAPVSGTITASPLKTGATVTANTSITTIGDVENLQITASIPERYVATLHSGLKANITLEAYPGVIFTATVTHVSPLVDKVSRTKEVILNFDNVDDRIDAGMFAKVVLYTQDYSGEITLPEESIIEKLGKQYVFTVKDNGTVDQNEVTLGKSVDGLIQILTGINSGDKVVVEGMRALSQDSKIKDITNGIPVKNQNEDSQMVGDK